MTPQIYREKWEKIFSKGRQDSEELRHLCQKIALSFLDKYYFNDQFYAEYIDLLCEIATCRQIPDAEACGSSALFGMIVEGLCDDFEELQTEAYDRVMSRIIHFCRQVPEGVDIDARLKDFGIFSENDLYTRSELLRHSIRKSLNIKNAKKILLLSRVTIGADVAVSSVMIQRLHLAAPKAEIVIIGDKKLETLFGGKRELRIRPLKYSRRGGLIERISTWHEVLDIVNEESKGFNSEEFVLVDTDSRLSQLGVLPVAPDSQYIFFRSRGEPIEQSKKLSMAELVNLWADRAFGQAKFCFPALWLPEDIANKGLQITARLKSLTHRKLIFINFGVGGNARKRVDGDFESNLVLKLIKEENATVLIDRGFGDEEAQRVENIIAKLAKSGIPVANTDFENALKIKEDIAHSLISISAGIGETASLIGGSDLYIGYDSACQHIAAALGIRTITIFAGTNNTRFVRRWRAFGPARSDLIHVDTLSKIVHYDECDILDRIMETVKE